MKFWKKMYNLLSYINTFVSILEFYKIIFFLINLMSAHIFYYYFAINIKV